MNKRKNVGLLCAGILVGTVLAGPAAHAVSNVLAERATQPIYVDGKQVELEAYAISGRNYVQLRDVGKAMGFNVTWDAATQSVQIDTQRSYQEEATSTANPSGTIRLPGDGSRYIPQAGDVIRCDDGSSYTITDVSRYDKNMFASGPVGDLPTPTCDWSSFPEVPLPPPETRRYHLDSGDCGSFNKSNSSSTAAESRFTRALGTSSAVWTNPAPRKEHLRPGAKPWP